ncbi:MAG TPA: bifunctional hexulose-6-phosphate synthase/ribonuclease regulator, partial [Candidatus Omnitrophica bacterium]|nr:bifunctional hexulose-6-phosphate synthase/ribonuclease regulator [Candidatus Omnitrophota bacterium]
GEIGVPLVIEGVKIETGDYVVGDDDGLVVIPKNILIETTNRAMSILEQENRLREEIDQGSTLAKVIELLRWEKRKG